MLKKLEGYKTYIGMVAGGVLGIAHTVGWIDIGAPVWQAVVAIVGTWTGVAIVHKANRAMKK